MTSQGCRGFTLIELLATLAITAFICGSCVSGLSKLVSDVQHRNAIQSMVTALERARSIAATRNSRVVLCNMDVDGECSALWKKIYLGAFIDSNKNRAHDESEELVFRQEWNPDTVHATWTNWLSDTVITYQGDGSVISNGTIALANSNDGAFARLIINKGGRLRLEKL